MRNFVQPGDSLAVAVPYAAGVTAGQGVLVGALFGVAAVDGTQNAIIEAATQGVFDLAKEPALAITAGARVFWDNTNRRVTTTATGNFSIGIATAAALAADATVRVWLNRSLTFTLHEVYLALAKTPIEGPAGVEASFEFRAAFNATATRMMTAALKNQQAGTEYA